MKVETDVEVTETVCHEDKIAHLQMIQGVIDRMSTSAAIYKGFAATIVTGIAAISFTEVSTWILLIAFFPVGCFLVMDTYYLKLEKQYSGRNYGRAGPCYEEVFHGRKEGKHAAESSSGFVFGFKMLKSRAL